MQNHKYEKFILRPVTTLPHYVNYILGFVVGVPLFVIYGETGFRYFGTYGLIFTFFVFGIIMLLLINFFMTKTIIVYFDQVFLYIEEKKKELKKYKKTDISGFYSYDYERVEKSFISIQINLSNGKNINLTDTSTSQTIDKEKAELLRRFLITAKKELNFSLVTKNSLRSIQKLGACWYSKLE
ncbi:hypothetical protein [Pedobacter sp. R20-19]|uniref:hypothetical protein n=1 Tax=Pedobacter sp. R20-19 TaxID=1270196 RepID=UPI00049367ED|nr:hypothetical protein [Pedobacter sp. R20-19]